MFTSPLLPPTPPPQAAELATTQFACCNVAASNICPPSDPDMLLQQQLQHAAANPGAPPLPALLCNWDALQLWILRHARPTLYPITMPHQIFLAPTHVDPHRTPSYGRGLGSLL